MNTTSQAPDALHAGGHLSAFAEDHGLAPSWIMKNTQARYATA
jgi:hypothetical protein